MSNLISLIGWTFLPNLVTGWVQTIYYSIAIRAGDPKPRPGTPRFAEHRRRIYILVVTLYLLYTIYEADHELRAGGTFYSDLSLPLTATERDVKSRFRRLAAVHHPDKSANQDQDLVNAYFVHLKEASDTLLDPARRFAYERFGRDAVAWAGGTNRCVTVRDFVVRGAQVVVPFYAAAAAMLYAASLFGYLDWARYERWVLLAVMFVFELHTVTRPGRPAFFEKVADPLLALVRPGAPYLPFQIIALARKLCITLYVAFSQIGPLIGADTSSGQLVVGGGGGKKGGNEEQLLRQNLERLELAARSLDGDTTRLLEIEMAPFAGDEQVVAGMKGKMKEFLVQNTIRADPMVRDALGRAFQKRRVDAPPGARGTK